MFGRSKSKVDPKAVEYEKLGRNLEKILISDYIELLQSTKRLVGMTFLKGIAGGLGGIIGATLGVTILLFLLAMLGGLPVIGDFFEGISQSIDKSGPN